ncbi:MAG: 6-phosphofructokinase [Xanthomonadaceae bacterium]|nr:6-phosphofructokinase [Xanthomonadaceae bacterium]
MNATPRTAGPNLKGKLLYAQSGGVTAVINASAATVIETCRKHKVAVYAARNGILGALREDLIDTTKESPAAIRALKHTPGGAFGSCRVKLKSLEEDRARYERLIEVFRAHGIRWFLYNGGNDSADTALKLSQLGKTMGYDIRCIGVPKTVDNDLAVTDCCPGFGSVAKYTAVSLRECALDVVSMMDTSTRVFVMEVMGRHAGWIAASAGLAGEHANDAPHIILFPERVFDADAFLQRVRETVERAGCCVVAASEGIRYADGGFVADAHAGTDAFGHTQLGGVAPALAGLVRGKLNLKTHWAMPDYLQRSARHVASKTDLEHALAVGKAAVELALSGENAVMPVIKRISDSPYRWKIETARLDRIANREKKLPSAFIAKDGFRITAAARQYLAPLIRGEAPPPYGKNGLPQYVVLKNAAVKKKLPPFDV